MNIIRIISSVYCLHFQYLELEIMNHRSKIGWKERKDMIERCDVDLKNEGDFVKRFGFSEGRIGYPGVT